MCFVICAVLIFWFFFFKQKTAYEMRISDWSSDVCSSDLCDRARRDCSAPAPYGRIRTAACRSAYIRAAAARHGVSRCRGGGRKDRAAPRPPSRNPSRGGGRKRCRRRLRATDNRSEEHTSEIQSLMRTSYAVFCLKKKKK